MIRTATAAFLLLAALGIRAPAAVTISGTVRYEDKVLSRPPTGAPESRAWLPVRQALVLGYDAAGTQQATATTQDDGTYSISWTGGDQLRLTLTTRSADGQVEVGAGHAGSAITRTYSWELAALRGSGTGVDLSVSVSSSSGALNIFDQLTRGRTWFSSRGYNFSKPVHGVWPGSTTQFNPEDFYIEYQSVASDPDEFDDDILLHEFGHMAMEAFSVDRSLGGMHSITQKVDLRLSFSEGAAHFISSAIRDDPWHVDSKGRTDDAGVTVGDKFSIANPPSASVGAENELAVACVLWNALQRSGGAAPALQALVAIPKGTQSCLDSFVDQWKALGSAADLSAAFTDRAMSYYADDLGADSSSAPVAAAPLPFSRTSLTFYPANDGDWFSFQAAAGENFDLDTGLTANGALTALKVYKADGMKLVASNAQRNATPTNPSYADTSSYIFLQVAEAGTYLVEISRFTSASKNYGLSWNDGYTATAGTYGSYAFGLQKTSATTADPNRTAISGYTPPKAEAVPVTTASSGGGGSGGGCLLRGAP